MNIIKYLFIVGLRNNLWSILNKINYFKSEKDLLSALSEESLQDMLCLNVTFSDISAILVKISKLPLDFLNRKCYCVQLYRMIILLT